MGVEEKLVDLLAENKYTISTAESCTGGLVASTIVNISGASSVFNQGYITYANEAKHKLLGVDNEIFETVGAVSSECAASMAEGCKSAANAHIGVSTTGIAGPGGGTDEKPVGLVYIGCAIGDKTYVEKNVFSGDRLEIRTKATKRAIEFVIEKMTLQN